MDYDLLAKLKLIGKLKKDEKLNTKQMFIQTNNIISKISRAFIFPDDRKNLLSFLTDTIEKSFDLINDDVVKRENILEDISLAIEGMKNIKLTYSSDMFFCCNIDVIIQNFENKINIIHNESKSAIQSTPQQTAQQTTVQQTATVIQNEKHNKLTK